MLVEMCDGIWMKEILVFDIRPVHRKNRKAGCEY